MHTLLEYVNLLDWEAKKEYHKEAEIDEDTTMSEYDKIDQVYWIEHKERERIVESGMCPDCNTTIQDTSYYSGTHDGDGGYVNEYKCACN